MKTPIAKLKHILIMTGIALSGIGGSGAFIPTNALTFNFIPTSTTSQQAIDGFTQAGNLWSSSFTDNVTINIGIDFRNIGANKLGLTSTYTQQYAYTDIYNALSSDRKSVDDISAVNSLANSPTFNMLINRTSDNPNGVGSAMTYLDNNGNANNNSIEVTTANAKALGLLNGNYPGLDASISFNNQSAWDFNRSNGIDPGSYDFIGAAAHEIGHVLGFYSGVDVLDNNPSTPESSLNNVTTLDLFRYSIDSKNAKTTDLKNVIDFTADRRDKYFSLDGGITKIASLATGVNFGDGAQAGHWQDGGGLGIMDPVAANGELLAITSNDLLAFDSIGWDTALTAAPATAVPEPSNVLGTFIFAIFGVGTIFKRKQKLAKLSVTVPEVHERE